MNISRSLAAKLRIPLVVFAAAYLAAASYLYLFQRSFVFKPGGSLAPPQEKGLEGVEVVDLEAVDGVKLKAWYSRADDGKPTFLYLHGNAGNISGRSERFGKILSGGYGLLALSYRGYPGSGGAPSEAAFISDGVSAYDWLDERTDHIIVYGESIGTAVAVPVAAERDPLAVVLEAPLSAAVDLAAEQYPWLPVGLLMKDQFRSRDRVGRISEPLLIVHGTDDAVVPLAQGRDLFARAGRAKTFHLIEGAGHGDLWSKGLWPAVDAFVKDLP
jgi:fermentation-respiration switch protein FrsA (DUF1100 family)